MLLLQTTLFQTQVSIASAMQLFKAQKVSFVSCLANGTARVFLNTIIHGRKGKTQQNLGEF